MRIDRRARWRALYHVLALASVVLWFASPAATANATRAVFGPYHGAFLYGGKGFSEAIAKDDAVLDGSAPWTMHAWIRAGEDVAGSVALFGVGDVEKRRGRVLALLNGKLCVLVDGAAILQSSNALDPKAWSFVAVTHAAGSIRLYVDGKPTGNARVELGTAAPSVHVAPVISGEPHFGGRFASVQLLDHALTDREVGETYRRRPDFALLNFHEVSVGWPWQTKQVTGLARPQKPATLPISKARFARPVARASKPAAPLTLRGEQTWRVNGWRMMAAPDVSADAREISVIGFDARQWYEATVPGTVLTTLIDRGVYPDPDFGLNNLAIPESLNKQDYWYRTEFDAPLGIDGQRLTLTFNGINYVAEIWLNGQQLGTIKGAFIRGAFDVTNVLRAGQNSLAVRISPPPHPGIPHEQSILAGPGENGGALALDGPTFIAAEGWDWIPGIRDRNSGLWRDVVLMATREVSMGDPQVVTTLPLPATDRADIEIAVPLRNVSGAPVSGTLTASFDGVAIEKQITVAPGESIARLTPEEFPALRVQQPRLWWPNGYGTQELYRLDLKFAVGSTISASTSLRFGIRHVTYEMSLFDERGHLRRVAVDPSVGRARGERLIDVRHEALKESPKGWAASLYPGALRSPGVKVLDDDAMTPHLVLVVNGVRIASRGGNWGMDDSRKRVSRERLEPYFRLHREANLNTIRNWVGQNTEEEFFELADEYGMLVLNDFWASTQDFQVEPEDAALFLANAKDTIARYRNHPSIVLWFGRNEGVPQPILNSGLAELVAQLDGTRHFMGSSNRVNLGGSGPYNYRPPAQYFEQLAEGYSVEVGTPSLATLESIRAWTPEPDRWPISDVLAYHDWHQGGNGDTASFMKSLETQFGPARDLEDFERKAQLMNYVTHRAMFEGFHAHLWSKNSGRLLWMTHPAWPSHAWQIYSSDYDTHAAFYGVKKACEPIHVQMNLPDYSVSVVNTTRAAGSGLTLRARVFDVKQRVVHDAAHPIDLPANAVRRIEAASLAAHIPAHELVFVKLEILDAANAVVAENFYWQGRDERALQSLNEIAPATVRITSRVQSQGRESRVVVTLENLSDVPAIATKLTLEDRRGARILPAYYSDNYVSLLAGEVRQIEIAYTGKQDASARIGMRGWNVVPSRVPVIASR